MFWLSSRLSSSGYHEKGIIVFAYYYYYLLSDGRDAIHYQLLKAIWLLEVNKGMQHLFLVLNQSLPVASFFLLKYAVQYT